MPRNSFAQNVAKYSLLAMGLVIAVLYFTRHAWFDTPSTVVQQQVDIVAQLTVGLGTGLLAVITWASVYETQAVLAGEDMRFRQSRMPMLRLQSYPASKLDSAKQPFIEVCVENVGDGFAEDVRVRMHAKVFGWWKFRRVVPNPHGGYATDTASPPETLHSEVEIMRDWVALSSFIQQGASATIYVPHDALASYPAGVSLEESRRGLPISYLEIAYRDAFEEPFSTIYEGDERGELKLSRFRPVRPPAYTLKKRTKKNRA